MVNFLTSRLAAYLIAGLSVAGLVGYIYWSGYSNAVDKREVQDLKDYKNTSERINETPVNRDVDAALDRLRSNGDLR